MDRFHGRRKKSGMRNYSPFSLITSKLITSKLITSKLMNQESGMRNARTLPPASRQEHFSDLGCFFAIDLNLSE